MALKILLHLSLLSALSIAALGQSSVSSTECRAAVRAFAESNDCLGSNPALRDGVLIEFESFMEYEAALMNPLQVFKNYSDIRLQGARAFNEILCSSQVCINLYTDVITSCLTTFRERVG